MQKALPFISLKAAYTGGFLKYSEIACSPLTQHYHDGNIVQTGLATISFRSAHSMIGKSLRFGTCLFAY